LHALDDPLAASQNHFFNRSRLNSCGRGLVLRAATLIAAGYFRDDFTIRASKDGETIETVRIGPTASVAKARGLFKTGWMVQIIDSEGLCYAPSEFDQLLSFDRHKAAKDTPKDDGLAVLENILADRRGRE
jgi:hypothetical protein